jgi:hypothetical protein
MSSYLNALDPEHLIAETLVEEDALQARAPSPRNEDAQHQKDEPKVPRHPAM